MTTPQPKTKAEQVAEILSRHTHKKDLSEFNYVKCRKLLLDFSDGVLTESSLMLLSFVELYGGESEAAYNHARAIFDRSTNITVLRNIHSIFIDLGDFKSASIIVDRILEFCKKSNLEFQKILPYDITLTTFLSGRLSQSIEENRDLQMIFPNIIEMVEVIKFFELAEENLTVISNIINKTLLKFNQRIFEMKYSVTEEEFLVLFYIKAEFKILQEMNADIFRESYKVGVHRDLEKISCYCVPYGDSSNG